MDLTDILFSKPFIGSSGGGGGSGSNVETATIEVTVTDSTPAITSGEFPDWLTSENGENIFGKVKTEPRVYGINNIVDEYGTVVIIASALSSGADNIAIAKDLSAVGNPNTGAVYEEGIFQITLLYLVPTNNN